MPSFLSIVSQTTSRATDRRTLMEIVDDLSRPIDASDSTVRALAADAFRSAVRTMNRKGYWPWEIQEEDLTITANERFSTATGAVKVPLAMHYLDAAGGSEDQPIAYSPYDEFLERYSLDIAGEASVYTIPNLFETGQVRWFPTPGADDYARFAYYRVTPIPRNDQDPVEIPDYATEVYMAMAWGELMKRLPLAQQVVPLAVAVSESRLAFRELSAQVNSTGDRSRVLASRLAW